MPQIASAGETLCITVRVERKGLKGAKKAVVVRMCTTIGGRRERRRRKLRVGFSVELPVKVIRKAESWLCPCGRAELRVQSRGTLCLEVCFKLQDTRVQINKSRLETGKQTRWQNHLEATLPPASRGKREPLRASFSQAAPGLTP